MTLPSIIDADPFKLQFLSLNFHGANVKVTSDVSKNDASFKNVIYAVFISNGRKIFQKIDAAGVFFISFHEFSFTGFRPELISIAVTAIFPAQVFFEGQQLIHRLPHVAFYTDLYPDHHQSYFFRMFRPDLVSYGKISEEYSDRGIVVMSANVDQSALPGQISQLAGPALEKLVKNEALLLIDQSHEGNPFDAKLMREIHQALQAKDIREDLVFFLNHTFKYADLYKNWADSEHLANRINVIYSNWYADGYFIKQLEYFNTQGGVDRYIEQQRFSAFSDIVRKKRYLSLNYTARPHRVLLILELLKRKYLDRGYVSFGGTRNSDLYKGNFYDVQGEGFLWSMGKGDLASYLPALDDMGAWTLDQEFRSGVMGEAIRMSATSPDDFFSESYFSIVTESEFTNTDFMRVTEKIFKPIMRLHPFIPVGNYRTLGMLEEMGYKRFDKFFNNGFDDVVNARERFDLIMIEVERLMSMSDQDIMKLYRESWDTLEHNFYVGYDYAVSGMKRHNTRILSEIVTKLREL